MQDWKQSGFKGATLKSLETCNNFKRTHCFLLQVWEALYRQLWNAYLIKHQLKSVTESASCILSASTEDDKTPGHLMHRIEGLLRDSNTQNAFESYAME